MYPPLTLRSGWALIRQGLPATMYSPLRALGGCLPSHSPKRVITSREYATHSEPLTLSLGTISSSDVILLVLKLVFFNEKENKTNKLEVKNLMIFSPFFRPYFQPPFKNQRIPPPGSAKRQSLRLVLGLIRP